MEKLINWLKQSNRYKHLLYAIPASFILTVLFGLGLGVGMELKDKLWGGKWDWNDLLCTAIGSVIGQILQLIVIYVLF